jgi:hypothetical protein
MDNQGGEFLNKAQRKPSATSPEAASDDVNGEAVAASCDNTSEILGSAKR